MAARDVRKNLNLFVYGRGYAGQIDEFNAPKLTLQTEEFRAGGMDLPIDVTMGMEKLVTDFSLKAYDRNVLALFGVAEGNEVPFVAREALESFDGTVTAVVHTMRGKITEIDPGTSKPGELPVLKVSAKLPPSLWCTPLSCFLPQIIFCRPFFSEESYDRYQACVPDIRYETDTE